MFYLWLSLYITIPLHGPTLKPCDKMSRKLCKDLGYGTFYCKIYVRIAQEPSARQRICKDYLNDPKKWKALLASLQKKEVELKKKETLAQRSGEAAARQFARDKRRLETFTILSMLKKNKKKKQSPPPPIKTCKLLQKRVCKDIGTNSYYCKLFGRMLRVKLNPRRCLFILQRWRTSLKNSFLQRESLIQRLTKNAQTNRELKEKVEKIKRHQGLQLLHFLSQ